jgi:PE family
VTLRVVPGGLAAAGTTVEALTSRRAAADGAVVPLITLVVPPAVDPVSLQGAAECSAAGAEHAAGATRGGQRLGRSGVGVGESGTSYAADAAAAASYAIGGGCR